MTYSARLASAHHLPPAKVEHCIAWEDPYEIDAPMKVTHPNPRCVAELMAGGIHPPVDAHWMAQVRIVSADGRSQVVAAINAPEVRRDLAPVVYEEIVDYSRCHNETIGPLSYDEAIEYILQKDVPKHVWGMTYNRTMFAIVRRDQIPSDRTFRNQWRLANVLN